MTDKKILVALAGQPNCGKSTVFNAMTGASQHVANYPGVTVDKMSGHYRYDGRTVEVVDLPGTYSLTSYSPEERVSRDFILHEKPSLVINVTDASNLKRSLYLTFQLMEMEIPLVLNLNMMDVAKRLGVVIDTEGLAEHLGVAVVPTSMKNGTGKKTLFNAVAAAADGRRKTAVRIDYGEMEPFLRNIEKRLADETTLPAFYPSRWVAIKLMEGDEEAQNLVRADSPRAVHLLRFTERLRGDFEARFDEAPELFIAHRRYREADDLERRYVTPGRQGVGTLSDRIDQVVCHRLL
ncbi:MAG: FeoB small GTPase domain-containing protein, partial [Desulfobacteraceae bacterium]|nr:FeoB small GTPase domain-containing protein [Desulfobacteraceae bacterium]